MAVPFVHLHNHTEYSLLDGAARISELIDRAAESSFDSIAITDHGVMYGVVPFYKEADRRGIKPILGVEAYITAGSRFDRRPSKEDPNHHLLLLAENRQGYRNMMKMVTLSYMDGYYYKPRIDRELLGEYHHGIIALSACLKGEIASMLLKDDYDAAAALSREYAGIFGESNFYLELMEHGIPEQAKVNEGLIRLGSELGIGLVASNDVHYVSRSDSVHHDVLLCIQTNSTVDQEDRLRFSSDQFYLKDYEEMKELFAHVPEALSNTVEIAERCNVSIDFGQYLLPRYQVPSGYDLNGYLEKLAREGLAAGYDPVEPELEERLRYELSVIREMEFSGYFLIVWDFIKYAKEHGIVVGPGRGSAAGSLVAYCLGITNVDPIKYGLLFERFLNPSRRTMPDIDIDFCYKRRPEVIEYVSHKYGEDRVAQIVTFSTMKPRAAIRDAGRVHGLEYGKVDRLAKMIPGEILNITLEEALDKSPELRDAYDNDEVSRRIIDMALKLEGITRQDSIHAAGVVIADDELSNYTPLQRRGAEEEVVTQFDMGSIQSIGLLKMDFLGLRTLTVISDTLENIERSQGIKVDIENIPFDDKKTFELLQRGDTIGVFQVESPGMRSLCLDLHPDCFEDLIAIVALFRPGPLGGGMLKDFVNRRRGRMPIEYIHPDLEPVLEETSGVIVYQEQVMKLAVEMAGYTMAEADVLRGVVAKSKAEQMKEQREKFTEGVVAKGYGRKLAVKLFELVEHFGKYGFNKSHSTAYALISYQTAFLKAHYPKEFMAANMTSISGDKDKLPVFVNECRKMNIRMLPPDINESYKEFTPVEEGIRFGLSAVRNLGDAAAERLIALRRENGPYESLQDFCQRVGSGTINKRTLESLIKSGAFDYVGYTRNHLLKYYDSIADIAAEKQRLLDEGQHSLFEDDEEDPLAATVMLEELEKDILLAYEKEMLGIYVTDHPLMQVKETLSRHVESDIADLAELQDGSIKWIGGIISKKTQRFTKKGDLMASLTLEDLTGRVEVTVFPALYLQHKEVLQEDRVVCVKARIETGEREEEAAAVRVLALDISEPRLKRPEQCDLYVDLDGLQAEQATMDELKEILKRHPGQTPVKLKLRTQDAVKIFRLPEQYKVNPDGSLYAEVLSLLGDGCIMLE